MHAVLGPAFTLLKSAAMNALHLAVFVRNEVRPARLRARGCWEGFVDTMVMSLWRHGSSAGFFYLIGSRVGG